MATNITKITPQELVGRGTLGMADEPELSAMKMQEKFDELSRDIIIPHINGMADEIDSAVDGVASDLADEVTRAQTAEGALSTKIGTLSSLTTTDKTDLVHAINEVNDGCIDLGLSVADGKLSITYNT